MRAVPEPLGTSLAVGKPTRPTAQLAGRDPFVWLRQGGNVPA